MTTSFLLFATFSLSLFLSSTWNIHSDNNKRCQIDRLSLSPKKKERERKGISTWKTRKRSWTLPLSLLVCCSLFTFFLLHFFPYCLSLSLSLPVSVHFLFMTFPRLPSVQQPWNTLTQHIFLLPDCCYCSLSLPLEPFYMLLQTTFREKRRNEGEWKEGKENETLHGHQGTIIRME